MQKKLSVRACYTSYIKGLEYYIFAFPFIFFAALHPLY